MHSKKNGKKKKKEEPKISLKEKITEILELPKEIVLNMPKMTLLGSRNLIIENYKGIIEYEDDKIRINTGIGIIKINGTGLSIKEITSEDIMVDGNIEIMEFLK
jgi:sporulation protein YqfC